MKSYFTKLTIIIFFILIFIKKDIMYITIYNTTLIWFKNIVPNLLPMFIITSLIVSSGLIITISNIFGRYFSKLFNTSIYGFYVFFLSLLTGCPSNAKYIKDLKNNNLISKEEQDKLILYTINYNPILIIHLLSLYLPYKTSIILLLINILTNIILAFIYKKKPIKILDNNKINNTINLSNIIKDTTDTLFMILGTLIVFNIIINLLPINNLLIKNIINGLLEITTGLKGLSFININNFIKILLTTIYLSFGGISIHTQIKSILPDTNYKSILKSRILSCLISIIIIIILYSMKQI